MPVYLLRKFRPDGALDAIESRRATVFIGVPAMYRMMLEAGAEDRDLQSVRMWASGADAMPDDLAAEFQRLAPAPRCPCSAPSIGEALFVDGYGMVELGGGVAISFSLPMLNLPVGSSAAFPCRGTSSRSSTSTGHEVRLGAGGRAGGEGARRDEGATTATKRPPPKTITDGRLVAHGRPGPPRPVRRRRVRRAQEGRHQARRLLGLRGRGARQALEQHPEVAEAAVIGLPDERKGEVPAAVVRRNAGASLTEDELVAWARDHMSDYKAPQRVVFVDELPRTGTDKVQKNELRTLFD